MKYNTGNTIQSNSTQATQYSQTCEEYQSNDHLLKTKILIFSFQNKLKLKTYSEKRPTRPRTSFNGPKQWFNCVKRPTISFLRFQKKTPPFFLVLHLVRNHWRIVGSQTKIFYWDIAYEPYDPFLRIGFT